MSNPCNVDKVNIFYVDNLNEISTNITGECARRLQYNSGVIREFLNIPKITGGITRYDRHILSDDMIQKIKIWRNRDEDRKEFYGYLDRNLNPIVDGKESESDSGVSKDEINALGDIDGLLFHTHPIYRDMKVVGPPSNDDIVMIYLDAVRTSKNKINIVFSEEGTYVYCLYPEAFVRILHLYNLQESKNRFEENIIKDKVSENLAVMMHNLGINTNDNHFIRPTLSKEEYMTLLRTCGIYIQLHPYDHEILIPIFDEVNIDFSQPVSTEPFPYTKPEQNKKSKSRLTISEEPQPLSFGEEPQPLEPQPLSLEEPQTPPKKSKTERRLNFAGDYKAKYLKYKMKYLELKKQNL
jgi:hypothetical protein